MRISLEKVLVSLQKVACDNPK